MALIIGSTAEATPAPISVSLAVNGICAIAARDSAAARRWTVEGTFAWLGNFRRLVVCYDR